MSDVQDNHSEGQPAAAGAPGVELFDFYVAQLEAYLDGELDSEEATQVRKRLMQEEAYAAALGRLHSQRIQRIEAYRRIEREETDLEAASRIAASARRIAVQQRVTHGGGSWPTWTKLVFGMAACLLVGFGAGMVGIYDLGEPPAAAQPNQAPQAPIKDGWVQYVNGEPQFSVPEGAQPLQMDEERMTPLIMPPDQTDQRIPN